MATGGEFSSTSDFEAGMSDESRNDSIASFAMALSNTVGWRKNGSVINGNLTAVDLIPDDDISNSLFNVDVSATSVKNSYPTNHNVLSGGTLSRSGSDIDGTTAMGKGIAASDDGGLIFQVGANKDEVVSISIDTINSSTLGIASASVATQRGAMVAIGLCDTAITKVDELRTKIGACQNRLEFTSTNLQNMSNNLIDARSKIEDADMAEEIKELGIAQILSQAGISMIAQSNQNIRDVVALLET